MRDFPYEINIELTNRCNLSCAMCARPTMEHPLGAMSCELFQKLVEEIAERQPHAYLHLYGIGESLLHPQIFDMHGGEHGGERASPCCYLMSTMTIAWDGRVALCFQDADVNEPMGDLNRQTIHEVWRSTLRDKKLEHIAGNFNGLCSKCTSLTQVRDPLTKDDLD